MNTRSDKQVKIVAEKKKYRRIDGRSDRSARASRMRDSLIRPELAEAFARREKVSVIAHKLNVSEKTVSKLRSDPEMLDLIKLEEQRIIDHMGTRPLDEVSYRDLAVSQKLLFERRQLEQGLPTQIISGEVVNRLLVGFFGPGVVAERPNPGLLLPSPRPDGAPGEDGEDER